jgi:hypothetical protein
MYLTVESSIDKSGLTHDFMFLYSGGMPSLSRKLASSLILALLASIFGPLFLCGGGPMNKAEGSACCRAMHFRCHVKDGRSSCCEHQTMAVLQITLNTPQSECSPQTPSPISLPYAVSTHDVLAAASSRAILVVPSHSPPEAVPLFLRHATLLI